METHVSPAAAAAAAADVVAAMGHSITGADVANRLHECVCVCLSREKIRANSSLK